MSRLAKHRAAALLWVALAVPAFLFWSHAVWFVILASLWANVYAALAALEGADNRAVLDRLDAIEAGQDQQAKHLLDLAQATRELAQATRARLP